jgi:phage N-6-adenine-methyltransferase
VVKVAILVRSNTKSEEKNRWGTTWRCNNHAAHLTGHAFILDACAEKATAKCANFISPEEDSLNVDWANRLSNIERSISKIEAVRTPFRQSAVWCNPPFDNKVEFIDECYRYSKQGITSVMLLPFERTTGWWRDTISNKASRVFVPDGRYPFLDIDGVTQKSGVNFSSCFVEFSPRYFNITEYVDFVRSDLDKKVKLGRAA